MVYTKEGIRKGNTDNCIEFEAITSRLKHEEDLDSLAFELYVSHTRNVLVEHLVIKKIDLQAFLC